MIKKNILQFILLAVIFTVMQALSGCGGKYVEKKPVPEAFPACDAAADEAMKQQNYEKSIILHEFFIKDNPGNGLAMYHLGFSHGQLGDHIKEVECYEKAIDLGYYGTGIFFNLGMAYGEMDRLEDSLRIFEKAVQVEPDNADNYFGLAVTYQKMAQYEKAQKEFEKVVELKPDDIDALYFLGLIYIDTGEIDKARDILEKINRLYPGSEMGAELKMRLDSVME